MRFLETLAASPNNKNSEANFNLEKYRKNEICNVAVHPCNNVYNFENYNDVVSI